MLRTKLFLAPIVGQNGFQAIDARPRDIVAGTDTKQTVLTKLGTPSTTSTFERDNVWYYISQVTEKYTYNRPQVTPRSETEIRCAGSVSSQTMCRRLPPMTTVRILTGLSQLTCT